MVDEIHKKKLSAWVTRQENLYNLKRSIKNDNKVKQMTIGSDGGVYIIDIVSFS